MKLRSITVISQDILSEGGRGAQNADATCGGLRRAAQSICRQTAGR